MEGTTVDTKYQVVRLLGQGGMGAVYEAVHRGTGRRVALKVIVPEALGEGDVLERFRREARASGVIDSQHVVQVLDTGIDPATKSPYLVMELLAGEDVAHLVTRTGPLAPEVVLRLVAQACMGLARAHREGIIHRDIKPANLFLAGRDEGELVLKLLDFGIAKLRPENLPASNRHKLTRSGSILGSPLYMSPEQIIGAHELDARSDVFSLGVTMYEMLCGHTPSDEVTNLGRLVMEICGGKGVPLARRAPHLPAAVCAIVDRATAVEPAHRYQTAAEMQAAVMALLPAGSAISASMLAPALAPRRLAETQLLRPKSAGPPDRTVALRVMDSAPDNAATGPVADKASGTLPAGFGATAGTLSGFGLPSRATGSIVRGAAALVLVCILGVVVFLRWPRGPAAQKPAASAATTSTVTYPASSIPAPEVVTAAPAVAVPSAPAPSASSARPGAKPRPKPKPRAVDCNPNDYFDSEGVKRFKEECVQ